MDKVGTDRRLNYYRMTPEAVLEEVGSHKLGLTNPEAQRRYDHLGANHLYHARRTSPLVTLARQFKSWFVAILLLSAALSLYLHDGKTATILILIALINAAVGFFQEHKAENLMRSLDRLLVPRATVLRNGALQSIDSSRLVLGDIIYLEEGDAVPADVRIMDEDELSTNDFALTGESNPSRKFTHAISAEVPLASRHNLAFMGTTVATGTAHGIVIGTGMHTELGRIAALAEVTPNDASPLQKEMNNLATRLTKATIVLAALLTVVMLQSHSSLHDAILFAIAIAAAMIPNGLIAEVNITLAQSANRMSKAKALVKKLSAVETLGATNIILTDKTGTLTQNEMTVTQLLVGRNRYQVTGSGYRPSGNITGERGGALDAKKLASLELFFTAGALASNATVSQPDHQHPTWYVLGDPTEGALVTLARKAGLNTEQLNAEHEEIKEFAFDSGRKLMSSVRRYGDDVVVFVKGAPEAILERSSTLWDHGHVRKLTAADRKFFTKHNDTQAEQALRNLAFAYHTLPKNTDLKKLDMDKVERNLTWLGMVSMQDPLRTTVPAAMQSARGAHVAVSVITGDYPTTAKAIAVQAKLAATHNDVTVIMSDELPQLADSQILQLIEHGGTVFSRVSPEDKLRIVEIAKASGRVTAVTGDGINDAPALKRADIGVAMGLTGTGVAKDAADIVLLDDSFDTLVGAIEQGRLTFANIKKAARCALTDNAGELLIILISLLGMTIFHIPMAITAIQILAIDIIAEMFPITALGWDKASHKLLRDKPRNLRDHLLTWPAAREFIGYGLLAAVLAYGTFLFYFVRHDLSPAYIDVTNPLYAHATILTYLTLVLCQFVNLLLVRSDDQPKFFTSYLWSNKTLLVAFAVSFFCIGNILYNPLIQPYFHAGPLSVGDWLTAIVAAAIYLGVRLIQRHTRHHTRKAVIKLHREVHGQGIPLKI